MRPIHALAITGTLVLAASLRSCETTPAPPIKSNEWEAGPNGIKSKRTYHDPPGEHLV